MVGSLFSPGFIYGKDILEKLSGVCFFRLLQIHQIDKRLSKPPGHVLQLLPLTPPPLASMLLNGGKSCSVYLT